MGRKGQVEFIVILALIVVIAVVVVSQMNVFTPTETSDSRLAKESVENMVRLGAYDTINKMSTYGGYLSPNDIATDYVTLNGKPVPYWQQAGKVVYPDKSANFMEGVNRYIRENKADLEANMNNVTLGEPVVSPPVFQNDKIIVTVTMPTVIKGTPYNTPYTVEVPTRFSEVFDFSKEFASYDASERPLEYFTLSTMFLSPMTNGFHDIPYSEMATDCGSFLMSNGMDVKPKIEGAIQSTLSYTYLPGKVPLNTLRTTSHPKYSLTPINGNSYSSIDLNFNLPDDFSLIYGSDFQMDPDPVSLTAEPIPLTGACISDPVNVKYFIRYPAIARVKDPETGSIFQFAVDVYIKDNRPGEWSAVSGYESTEQGQVCSELNCQYGFTVNSLSGKPVSGASVRYMGCYLGRTDAKGNISGLGPCGMGMLRIFANGYGEYGQFVSYDTLSNTSFQLRKRVPLNLIFYQVTIDTVGENQYMIKKGVIEPIDGVVMMRLLSDTDSFEVTSDKAALSYNILVEDNYSVGGSLVSSDMSILKGAFLDQIDISYIDGLSGGQNVYIYIPKSMNFEGLTDNDEVLRLTAIYSTVLTECGIRPVSTKEYVQEKACAVTVV